MSPKDIEAQVKKEWKQMKFNEARRACNDRKAMQAMDEINRAVSFDRSMASGTAPSGNAGASAPSGNAGAHARAD